MAHASEIPSQCSDKGYPPQAPPGHCWGTYIATKYSVQSLVGSLDLHGDLASEIHTAVWESLLQLFHIQLYFFFLPCHPGDIIFVSSVRTQVLFSHFVLPPCYPFIRFPPAISLPSWTQEPGTNTYFKSGGEAISWKQIFFQALNIRQQTLQGSACYHNRLCGKTQPCLSHLLTVFLGFDEGGTVLHLRVTK